MEKSSFAIFKKIKIDFRDTFVFCSSLLKTVTKNKIALKINKKLNSVDYN